MREHHQREVDALTPDYDLVTPHLREGMREYVQRGHVPGDFLQALIANDLNDAYCRADEISLACLGVLTAWLYNEAPGGCWGSRGILHAWSRDGGLEGRAGPQPGKATPLTFVEAEAALNDQNPGVVVAAMTEWHPTILAEMLKAVTEARYIRYGSSHPDWTAAVREVAKRAGLDVGAVHRRNDDALTEGRVF